MNVNKVIVAEALSKQYRQNGLSLRAWMAASNPWVRAVEKVSFSIAEGESVGIIGGNGSGKTTLLRLISGITKPSSGNLRVFGTVATLLEVGAGMHPELSGRQNIAIAASLMGMSAERICEVTAQVIEFANIGEAIDRPLRTYSSGMRLRLGFAVAAHVDTPIVVLDEALAVGDSAFQVRCLQRVFELRNSGRTILFVSHDLSAVRKLCARTLVLHHGHLVFDGPTDQAISLYRNLNLPDSSTGRFISPSGLVAMEVHNHSSSSETKNTINFEVMLEFAASVVNQEIDLGLHVNDAAGNRIHHFSNKFLGLELSAHGKMKIELCFDNFLKPANYFLSVYLGLNDVEVFWLPDAIPFEVVTNARVSFHRPEAIQAPVVVPFEMRVV